MWCHFLLAMPVLGLALFGVLPLPYALPGYLVVSLPAVGIVYLLSHGLDKLAQVGPEATLGAEGKVVELRENRGMSNCLVSCRGELWSARALTPVRVGQTVRIVGFEGNRPLVRAVPGEESAQSSGDLDRTLNLPVADS